MMNKFYKTIKSFLTVFLPKQKCYSENTIVSYRYTLNLLIEFLSKEKGYSIEEIGFEIFNHSLIVEFLNWLQASRNNSISTQNQRLNSLRTFFKYACIIDCSLISLYMELQKIPLKKEHYLPVEFLSKESLKALLNEPDLTSAKGLRNRFFMILLYDTAARCQEILDLRLNDIVLSDKTPFLYITGKGNKTRTVPLMKKTIEHLNQYLEIYHPTEHRNKNDYLFYTVIHDKKNQMSPDTVAYFMKKYGQSAATKVSDMPYKIHPHQMRHTRAIHLYRDGMPLPLLSEFLGHKNLDTTNIYAYADTEMKRNAIEKTTLPSAPTSDIEPIWKNNTEMLLKLCGLK